MSWDILFNYWSWWVLAGLLVTLEIFAPGSFMLWLGIAAAMTGLLTLVFPIGWAPQLLAFAVFAVLSVIAGRAYLKRHPIRSSDNMLNRRGERIVGQVVTVVVPFVGGEGKVQVGDSPWLATGPDMVAGTRCRVIRLEGSRLVVAPEG